MAYHERDIAMSDLIERYLACWNETGPAARRKLVDDLWAEDASYVDPMVEARGRDAIDATIAAVQEQFPGLVFTLAGTVDAHHRQARFTWGLGPQGAEPIVIGFDVAVADEDGRLVSVFGFLDKIPA
jgi:SnoaL-like domain